MYRCKRGCGREFGSVASVAAHSKSCDGTVFPPNTRRCSACREIKPGSDFPRSSRATYCKSCHNAYRREMRARKEKRRVCGVCQREMSTVAFRVGSTICMSCKGERARLAKRVELPTPNNRANAPRQTFAEWARVHRITDREMSCVRTALARYGRKGAPCPYDIIAEFCGPERYIPGGPPPRAAVLRHAVVLMASERRSTPNSESGHHRDSRRAA